MVVKVAMADHFQFKVMPSIKNFCLLKQGDVHYIGGTDILPAPLGASEEQNAIEALGTASDAEAKHTLIEHNLRLVVYIAKKFDNTGVGVEDLISIGTIGLIKAINSYDKDKNIKLATYASRCIENEILMYLRRNSKIKAEVSIDEPLNVDWDGNELLLSDIIGTDEDIIYKDIETEVECKMLKRAINQLPFVSERIFCLASAGLRHCLSIGKCGDAELGGALCGAYDLALVVVCRYSCGLFLVCGALHRSQCVACGP